MFSLANLLHATVSTIASRVGDVVLSLSVGWSGEISPVSLALVYDLECPVVVRGCACVNSGGASSPY